MLKSREVLSILTTYTYRSMAMNSFASEVEKLLVESGYQFPLILQSNQTQT